MEDLDEEEIEELREKHISIEVRYRTKSESGGQDSKEAGMMPYIILLGGIIVIILIVMLALCIYNRIAFKTTNEKIAEHAHAQKEGKLEKQVSLQYDPGNLKVDDDLVYTTRISSSRGQSRDSVRPMSSSRPLQSDDKKQNDYAQAEAAYEAKTDVKSSFDSKQLQSDLKRLEGDDSVNRTAGMTFEEGRREKAFTNQKSQDPDEDLPL